VPAGHIVCGPRLDIRLIANPDHPGLE
jgi:hypothetical protein